MRPRLAACILITFTNTRGWAGRQIAFLDGANRRAIMRRLITQIFLLAAPLSAVLARQTGCRRWGTSPPRIFTVRTVKKRAHVQISLCANDLALPMQPRRTRGAPFPRGDILRTFCTYAVWRRGRRAHVLQCSLRRSPEFSNVLRPLFSSFPADRSLKS